MELATDRILPLAGLSPRTERGRKRGKRAGKKKEEKGLERGKRTGKREEDHGKTKEERGKRQNGEGVGLPAPLFLYFLFF